MKSIRVFPRELVLDDPQMPFTFDGTLCTLRQPDGKMRVWETDLGTKPYYFIFEGSKENPLETRVGDFQWEYNGYSRRWPDGIWVQSFYQVKPEETDHPAAQTGDLLVGFTHREQFSDPFNEDGSLNHSHGDCNSYHIGLAISLDRGWHWYYNGDLVGNLRNYKKELANMGGVPFFTVDGQFQFFFNEYPPFVEPEQNPDGKLRSGGKYLSAARCDIKETVAALLDHKLPTAFKYSGDGKWETDPWKGTGAPILDSAHEYFDAHADACYCSALGKYLVTGFACNPARLCLFISPDGVHFNDSITLYNEDNHEIMNPYSTFVAITEDDSTPDCSVVGREFYVFYPRKGTKNYGFDQWYRQKIAIED